MKLLFDQNLSPRLVDLLSDLFAGSSHVQVAGLDRADDEAVWSYAQKNGFVIVTKDSDFQERSQITGSAPCVVWIRRGNCSTAKIAAILRNHAEQIVGLGQEQAAEFLILF